MSEIETRAGGVLGGWNHLPGMGAMDVKEAKGARILSASGKWYDDYIMGWGSCLLGHDSVIIRESIIRAMRGGFLQQYETRAHRLLSEQFCEVVPCAEKLRLVNSGLEATMYAVRIARAVTNRRIILKFEGHFHGLNDALTWNVDSSPHCGRVKSDGSLEQVAGTVGIPDEIGQLTIPLPWNDLAAVRNALEAHKGDVAGIILEPVALNMGCIRPDNGFLQSVRKLASQHGALLIFDEVLTGFRSSIGGAQEEYKVIPDVATYGKAFGCGMPIAGIAGKAEYMDFIAPVGSLQVCGTNSGRYLSVVAALAAIDYLRDGSIYSHIALMERKLRVGVAEVFHSHKIPCYIDGYGGRVGIHIGMNARPRSMRDIAERYPVKFAEGLFKVLSEDFDMYGFLMPLTYCPEPVTLSAAHTPSMVERACDRLDLALKRVEYNGQ